MLLLLMRDVLAKLGLWKGLPANLAACTSSISVLLFSSSTPPPSSPPSVLPRPTFLPPLKPGSALGALNYRTTCVTLSFSTWEVTVLRGDDSKIPTTAMFSILHITCLLAMTKSSPFWAHKLASGDFWWRFNAHAVLVPCALLEDSRVHVCITRYEPRMSRGS